MMWKNKKFGLAMQHRSFSIPLLRGCFEEPGEVGEGVGG
jgi:hypothetical protein